MTTPEARAGMSSQNGSLHERYDAFLLDLDGVLYRGEEAIPGAAEAVSALRRRGPVIFVTNNSARTPERVAAALQELGFDARPEDVVTSAQAVVPLVRRYSGDAARVFVVGEEGVTSALKGAGMDLVGPGSDRADAVVVGWDRTADYEKLRRASLLVQRGAKLIATNADVSYPAPSGEAWPGTGALLSVIEMTTGVRAEVAGKPQAALFELALERAGTRNALSVGDRLDTDVAGAVAAGLHAALVLSGVASRADLLDHDALPVAVFDSLAGALRASRAISVRAAMDGDEPGLRRLLDEAGLTKATPSTHRLIADGAPATASIRVEGEEAYLHSVAVGAEARGSGVGTLVVAAAIRDAARLGSRACFLVTESAEGFFTGLGFEAMPRDDLPGWVGAMTSGCSASSVAMRRPIVHSAQGSVSRPGSRAR